MRRVFFLLAPLLLGCAREPVSFPVTGDAYRACLETNLRKTGREFAFQPAPTAWGAKTSAIVWLPSSEDEERRIWCEAAFCTAGKREHVGPDMCANYK